MPGATNSINLTVFLVGANPDDAATSMPFTDYRGAQHNAADEQPRGGEPPRVFSHRAARPGHP